MRREEGAAPLANHFAKRGCGPASALGCSSPARQVSYTSTNCLHCTALQVSRPAPAAPGVPIAEGLPDDKNATRSLTR